MGQQNKTHPSDQRFRNKPGGQIIVRTSEEALDGEEDGADVVGGGPLVLEDVEADVAVDVDVGVEAGGVEPHLGRLVRVLGGEGEPEAVGRALVGGAAGPGDGAHPVEDVVPLRERRHARVAAHHQRHQLRLQPPHHRLALRAAPGGRWLRLRLRWGRRGDVAARLRVAVLAPSHGPWLPAVDSVWGRAARTVVRAGERGSDRSIGEVGEIVRRRGAGFKGQR
jgi:hypothetical protein